MLVHVFKRAKYINKMAATRNESKMVLATVSSTPAEFIYSNN